MIRIISVFLLGALLLAGSAIAADFKDGRALIVPIEDDRFAIEGFEMGKAQLFGYVADVKETRGITGLVLRRANRATDEQRNAIASIAKALGLEAFAEERRKLVPMVAANDAVDAAEPEQPVPPVAPVPPAAPAEPVAPVPPAAPAPPVTPVPA